jgi:hypothetical protein
MKKKESLNPDYLNLAKNPDPFYERARATNV